MKTKQTLFLLTILCLGIISSHGQSIRDTAVVDYGIIDSTILDKVNRYGAEEVLVVLDIDNTILTGDTDLGSDLWYQWQNSELEIKPTQDQKLTKDCLFNEAINLLYELGTMSLTDSLLPDYIKKWQNGEISIMALTSRSPHSRAATERELLRNHIDLRVTEPQTIEGNKLSLNYALSRDLSYRNGIFMTSGMNKGEMLAHIMSRLGRSYQAIVFVDDTRGNIDSVKNRYSACSSIDLTLFHYTRILSERLKINNHRILTQEQADKMARDWETLIETLNTIFPERVSKTRCAD
ncbi:MAG: DUF2608 domain-containing protein [Candidatus Delongbacteria bacterium]|nr:DUF2608 domain-containing protein [Candidatus Delongbacteria bacterium]